MHWALGPTAWPEDEAASAEKLRALREAIGQLSPSEREVLTLRDVAGCSAAETCNALRLSDTNHRVLLHRARSSLRATLERKFESIRPTL